MNLSQLIERFRSASNDKVEPYFWSDEEVTQWLNDAEIEAAVRGRLIHESDNSSMCSITVVGGKSVYPLHAAIYELTNITLLDESLHSHTPIKLISTEALDGVMPGWRFSTGNPAYAVQMDRSIRLVPTPMATGRVHVEGYRMPKREMEDVDDFPEINHAHHRHLVCWALHKAFSIPDAELFDSKRAELAEQEFTKYFGLPPDSDLRRITREDVPHHVQAFFP